VLLSLGKVKWNNGGYLLMSKNESSGIKAAYVVAAGAIIAALIAGVFTLIKSDPSPESGNTISQTVGEKSTAVIHTGEGDVTIGNPNNP
jgi:hypothetical protein